MHGDFTRDTFDPTRRYSRVLMQQGRVQVDADFNEQTSILLRYLRTLTVDIFGPHAGPVDKLGFEIVTKATWGTLSTDQRNAKLALLEPDAELRALLAKALDDSALVIGHGRYYVDGLLAENDRAIRVEEQPGYPFSEVKLDMWEDWDDDTIVYLDVWERSISHVQDDNIREVALLGPDTCNRPQVFWQVKALAKPADHTEPPFGCESLRALLPQRTGRLRARARRDQPATELCVIPPESRYRGAENALYRVEVHAGGVTGGQHPPTFKWSRNNGSANFPIRTIADKTIRLEHLGRDAYSGLQEGDWVEVIDDVIAGSESSGALVQVEKVNRNHLSVTVALPSDAPPIQLRGGHPLLRRWDHASVAEDPFGGALPITEKPDTADGRKGGWIDLEDGIQIWFAQGGRYFPGDYWLIPARTATGNIVWPHQVNLKGEPERGVDGNLVPEALTPHGPQHHYAPLAFFGTNADGNRAWTDCRCAINRLPCLGR